MKPLNLNLHKNVRINSCQNQIKNKFGLVKNPSSWEINNIIRF